MNNSYRSCWELSSKNKFYVIKPILLSITVILYLFISTAHGEHEPWMVKVAASGELTRNIDLPGSDITSFELKGFPPSPQLIFDLREYDCANACENNTKCVAWTYVVPKERQNPGTCWLKHSVPEKKSDPCCVSGSIGDGNTDRPGGDYTHFDNVMGIEVTPQLCKSICASQDKCEAWTFVKPNTSQGPKGVCWLKDTVSPPVANNCCISGYFRFERPIR